MIKITLFFLLSSCTLETPEYNPSTKSTGEVTQSDTASPVDADGDGYVADEDCDDDNVNIYPGADEYCDGVDDDCDGDIDEDDAVDASIWYADADGDGYGNPDAVYYTCYQPTGYVADDTDCDDSNAMTYSGADEYCDGVDDDCDGDIDEDDAVDASIWYADADGDGYGNVVYNDVTCYQPTGYVSDDTDCDDTNVNSYPGADEYCDGEDDDCDGNIDEDDAVDVSVWYADADGDGYGDANNGNTDCYRPTDYVSDDTDCDDTNVNSYPGADEYCDGEDDDCDGNIDEDDAVDVSVWYADADGDGYGDAGITYDACSAPTGYVSDDTDCDDTNVNSYPGADEYELSGWDEDCDGLDGRELSSYEDDDGDWLAPLGVNLITDTDFSTLESGSSWGGNYWYYYASSWSSYPSSFEVVNFKPGGAVGNIHGNCIRGYNVAIGVLTDGDEYVYVASVANTNSSGSVTVAMLSPLDVDDYTSVGFGSTAYSYYGQLSAGDEGIIGGVFVADSTDLDNLWICAYDDVSWAESGVEVTHFGVYETSLVP